MSKSKGNYAQVLEVRLQGMFVYEEKFRDSLMINRNLSSPNRITIGTGEAQLEKYKECSSNITEFMAYQSDDEDDIYEILDNDIAKIEKEERLKHYLNLHTDLWLYDRVDRNEAQDFLLPKQEGRLRKENKGPVLFSAHFLNVNNRQYFMVRISSQPNHFALSVKVDNDQKPVNHYLIVKSDLGYEAQGSNLFFPTLPSLLAHFCCYKSGGMACYLIPPRLKFSDCRKQHQQEWDVSLESIRHPPPNDRIQSVPYQLAYNVQSPLAHNLNASRPLPPSYRSCAPSQQQEFNFPRHSSNIDLTEHDFDDEIYSSPPEDDLPAYESIDDGYPPSNAQTSPPTLPPRTYLSNYNEEYSNPVDLAVECRSDESGYDEPPNDINGTSRFHLIDDNNYDSRNHALNPPFLLKNSVTQYANSNYMMDHTDDSSSKDKINPGIMHNEFRNKDQPLTPPLPPVRAGIKNNFTNIPSNDSSMENNQYIWQHKQHYNTRNDTELLNIDDTQSYANIASQATEVFRSPLAPLKPPHTRGIKPNEATDSDSEYMNNEMVGEIISNNQFKSNYNKQYNYNLTPDSQTIPSHNKSPRQVINKLSNINLELQHNKCPQNNHSNQVPIPNPRPQKKPLLKSSSMELVSEITTVPPANKTSYTTDIRKPPIKPKPSLIRRSQTPLENSSYGKANPSNYVKNFLKKPNTPIPILRIRPVNSPIVSGQKESKGVHFSESTENKWAEKYNNSQNNRESLDQHYTQKSCLPNQKRSPPYLQSRPDQNKHFLRSPGISRSIVRPDHPPPSPPQADLKRNSTISDQAIINSGNIHVTNINPFNHWRDVTNTKPTTPIKNKKIETFPRNTYTNPSLHSLPNSSGLPVKEQFRHNNIVSTNGVDQDLSDRFKTAKNQEQMIIKALKPIVNPPAMNNSYNQDFNVNNTQASLINKNNTLHEKLTRNKKIKNFIKLHQQEIPRSHSAPNSSEEDINSTDDDKLDNRENFLYVPKKQRWKSNKEKKQRSPTQRVMMYIYRLSTNGSPLANKINSFNKAIKQRCKNSNGGDVEDTLQKVRKFMDGVKHHFMVSKFDIIVRKYKHQLLIENSLTCEDNTEDDTKLNEKLEVICEQSIFVLVLKPVYNQLVKMIRTQLSQNGDLDLLHDNFKEGLSISPVGLGINAKLLPPDSQVISEISEIFKKMPSHFSPLKKLELLLEAVKLIYKSVREKNDLDKTDINIGADDLLPIFIYTLIHTGMKDIEIESIYMSCLLDQELLIAEGGYYLITLCTASY